MKRKNIIIIAVLVALTAAAIFVSLRSKTTKVAVETPEGFERVSDTEFAYPKDTPKDTIEYTNSGFSQTELEVSINGKAMAVLTLKNSSSSILNAKLIATPDNPTQDDPPVEINPGSDTTYILDSVGVYKITNANKQDHTITITVN